MWRFLAVAGIPTTPAHVFTVLLRMHGGGGDTTAPRHAGQLKRGYGGGMGQRRKIPTGLQGFGPPSTKGAGILKTPVAQ